MTGHPRAMYVQAVMPYLGNVQKYNKRLQVIVLPPLNRVAADSPHEPVFTVWWRVQEWPDHRAKWSWQRTGQLERLEDRVLGLISLHAAENGLTRLDEPIVTEVTRDELQKFQEETPHAVLYRAKRAAAAHRPWRV